MRQCRLTNEQLDSFANSVRGAASEVSAADSSHGFGSQGDMWVVLAEVYEELLDWRLSAK